jgi:hypothetical protein
LVLPLKRELDGVDGKGRALSDSRHRLANPSLLSACAMAHST